MSVYVLSRAQKEVANLILLGNSNQEIANKLFICEKTVKFHITDIFRITGSATRHQFMAKMFSEKELTLLREIESLRSNLATKINKESVPELPR